MPGRPSLLGRALAALGLSVGFYLFALAIVAGLLWLVKLEFESSTRVHPRAILLCLAGAGAILVAIVPRRDEFDPPGPRLDPSREPRLFRFLEEVAQATGERPPEEVYLLGDLNAFVGQRGGYGANGGRRVMGIGMPLFALLTRAELRAVLAHEFGHFHGGDIALGPWIYGTRAAIGRTCERLRERKSIVRLPFVAYGFLFRRVTLSLARAQELAADALAAQVAGTAAQRSALEKTHAFGAAYRDYWREASAVLGAGFRPRLIEGFASCLEVGRVREEAAQRLAKLAAKEETDPDDTHPSLHRRLAALAALPAATTTRDDARARTLLDHEDDLELDLLSGVAPPEQLAEMTPIAWDEVSERITLPNLRALAAKRPEELAGLTLRDVARTIRDLNDQYGTANTETRNALDLRFERLRCAAMLAYVRGGFALRSPPGDRMWLVRDGTRRDIYSDALGLSMGELSDADWIAHCEADGVADLRLADAIVSAAG